MAIWALLDEKGNLVLWTDAGPRKDTLLVGELAELEQFLDMMPHGKAKRLRLTELVPKPNAGIRELLDSRSRGG